MRIPNLYKDRRIEGDTPLRQCQLVELHLLQVLKKICDDHKIKFWLCAGTLLGAMRHKGFIPWDDDLDVMMLKKDYPKFLKYAKEELPEDVFLDLPIDDEACREENSLTRLRDNYSTGILRHNKRLQINDHHGIQIELFLLEECWGKSKFTNWILHNYVSNKGWFRRAHFDKVTLWNLVRKWCMGIWVFTTWSVWRFIQALPCKRKYLVPTNFYTAWREWLPREWFLRDDAQTRVAIFEDNEMPIPFGAEAYLQLLYKDWRKLPPEKDRRGYLGAILPVTPCMHPVAMKYPGFEGIPKICGGTLNV